LWRPFDVRPLTYLTFWLNQLVNGRDPAGYHAVNLALHATAVVLMWAALRLLTSEERKGCGAHDQTREGKNRAALRFARVGQERKGCGAPSQTRVEKPRAALRFARVTENPAALVAAAIFAVHPFQAEPVNYVFARSTTLATLLCLAALLYWARGQRWWAVPWFGLALLAKEECVAFPALLFLIELWRSRKSGKPGSALKSALPPILVMFALAAAAGIRVLMTTAQIAGSGAGANAGITWKSYALGQGVVILRYLRMLVLPWGFTVDPDIAVPPVWVGLLAWAAVAVLAILAAVLAWRGHEASLWFLSGLIVLLPSSSILPAADLAADRRLYLPLIGFAAAAGLLLVRFRPEVAVAVVAGLAFASAARTETWRTEESLWQDAAGKAPLKVRPKIQLARAVEPERGIAILQQARALAPRDPRIPSEEGRLYLTLGRPDQALMAFGRALALDPRSAEAYNNRGAALLALNQKQPAQQDFERALAIDSCQFDARLNLKRLGAAIPPGQRCRYSPDQSKALIEK
jgi:protein O-mannosyl-transferase